MVRNEEILQAEESITLHMQRDIDVIICTVSSERACHSLVVE